MEDAPALLPGWYIRLGGERLDLEDWEYSLNAPFDPVVIKDGDATYFLISSEVQAATTAEEARQRGLGVVARINGAMRIIHGCGPIRLHNVTRVDEAGLSHQYLFAEMMAVEDRCVMRATAVVHGSDGKPLPPPPPQPSAAQAWNALATVNDDIADLLAQHGRADDWYEKTLEIAQRLTGGKKQLEKLLGTSGPAYVNLRETANFFRHAHANTPPVPTTYADAKPLLSYIVRFVLDRQK